jgi:hypothetical protein
MILGLVTIKPYKKLNNQFIGTQFFVLGIPLFPLNSYFFIDDCSMQNIEIGIHNGHIAKIYSSILVFILSVLLFIPQFIDLEFVYKVLILSMMILLLVIFFLKYDSDSDEEKDLRLKIGQIVGINLLPKEMDINASISLKNQFIKTLQLKCNTVKYFNEILDNELYTKNDLTLIFIILLYEYRIQPNFRTKEKMVYFYNKAYGNQFPNILIKH